MKALIGIIIAISYLPSATVYKIELQDFPKSGKRDTMYINLDCGVNETPSCKLYNSFNTSDSLHMLMDTANTWNSDTVYLSCDDHE